MDRRAALLSLFGVAGAAAFIRWSSARLVPVQTREASKPARAQPPFHQAGTGGIAGITLSQIPLGGGGFVTGIDISADGQRFVCRTDVANAYIRDAQDPAWRPLFSPSTMMITDYDPLPAGNGKADGQGVAGIRIAPSNKNIIVASYHGYVWKSVDGGRSVRRTRLPQKAMPSNAGVQRLYNRTIDVHPSNPQQILVGTHGEGVWFTLDGGDRWNRARLPETDKSMDGLPGINLVLFDPTAASRVYVFVTGHGLYRSDNGPGGEFRSLGGGPSVCSNLVAGPSGTIYLCEVTKDNGGKVWRYETASGWSSSKPEHEAQLLAIDPRKPKTLIASNPNGYFMISDDAGRTWQSIGGAVWNRTSGELAWTRGLGTMFPAEIRFDPATEGRLVLAQGVGVATTAIGGNKLRLEDWSAGIEELCAVATLSVPGGRTFLSAWDKPFWRVADLTSYGNDFRYPVRAGKSHNPDLVAFGSFMDYAWDDPQYLVGIVAPSDSSAPGYTADGGDNWHAFSGTPATGWGYGGCIAASTKSNFVLLPSNNGVGVYTLDGGRTWPPIQLDGVHPTGGFANAFYVARKNITADKTRPGTFALVYTVMKGNGYGEPLGGVWLTNDGGRSWDQVLKGVISIGNHDPKAVRSQGLEERQFWQCQLDYVPGRSGELVYTPHADYSADRFFWSQDNGKSWTELHNAIRNVRCFGFGKAASGALRPALYFWGEVAEKEGLYVSFDWFASAPRLITRFPSSMLASVSSIAGDPNWIGRVYVGTSCAGWVQVDIEKSSMIP